MRLCAGVSFPATECSVIVAVGDGVWMLEISALAADGDSVMSAAIDNCYLKPSIAKNFYFIA